MWASNTHPGMNVVAEVIRAMSSDHLDYYIKRRGCRRTVGFNCLYELEACGNHHSYVLRKKEQQCRTPGAPPLCARSRDYTGYPRTLKILALRLPFSCSYYKSVSSDVIQLLHLLDSLGPKVEPEHGYVPMGFPCSYS